MTSLNKKMLRSRIILITFALLPTLSFADFCDILAGNGAPSCRSNAENMDAKIFGNWLRIKPEAAMQASTGKKGKFVSATTPAYRVLGVKVNKRPKFTIDCFTGMRSMRIDALPYMLGFTNGKNSSFTLTFKVDNRPAFTEDWPLYWQRAELQAPDGSNLANELQGARDLTITTKGIVGNKSDVGYIYKLDGFDVVNANLCL